MFHKIQINNSESINGFLPARINLFSQDEILNWPEYQLSLAPDSKQLSGKIHRFQSGLNKMNKMWIKNE